MPPEIANKRCNRYEADSWDTVDTVMACLLTDRCRPEVSNDAELKKYAQQVKRKVPGFQNFTPPLKTFRKSCVAYNPLKLHVVVYTKFSMCILLIIIIIILILLKWPIWPFSKMILVKNCLLFNFSKVGK